jgi:peptidoglycan/xylan/chitin deacetylase (PgdA/CDA1 family)
MDISAVNTTVIPVLLYHSVSEGPSASWGAVSREEFESHLDVIVASGRQTITIATLADALRGDQPLPECPVAITFDDGYSDTYQAVELLCGRNLCSTVYVTTGEIGAADRLSHEQLTRLARIAIVELGAHGVRHLRLDELDDDELVRELRLSKAQLERLTSERIDSFAYPHGAYDRRVREAVIAAGYGSAAAVKNALCHPKDDPFAIARWTVTAATPAERIAEVLEGEGVPLAWSRERLRTRAYRTARRQRRRLFGTTGAPC